MKVIGRRLLVLALAGVSVGVFLSGIVRRRRATRDAGSLGSVRLSPLLRADREVFVRRLATDPLVVEAARVFAGERGVSVEAALGTAERYARGILPDFNASLHSRFAMPLAGRLVRAMYRFQGTAPDLREAAGSAVVLVMSHRSNLDYVLLAHLFADRAVLSFAAGEWAGGRILGPFVRALGSYFVRRDSGDALHRGVLARFVGMAVEERLTQVVFPEGGLSRDGLPREPKIGLLDYLLRQHDPESGPDVVFVPVAAGYDRILEDRSMVAIAERGGGPPPRGWLARSVLGFAFGNLRLFARGGRGLLGRAVVNAGGALSLREYAAARGVDFRALGREERIEEARQLARELMRRIEALIPALPVPLVAHALLDAPEEKSSEGEIAERVADRILTLQQRGACVPVPRADLATSEGLRMLTLRRLVTKKKETYRPTPNASPVLRYHANTLAPLLESAPRKD